VTRQASLCPPDFIGPVFDGRLNVLTQPPNLSLQMLDSFQR
jgi:hypothetical protein